MLLFVTQNWVKGFLNFVEIINTMNHNIGVNMNCLLFQIQQQQFFIPVRLSWPIQLN